MASSNSNSNATSTLLHSYGSGSGSDPTTPNTTFVQADPSNFRAVVQKLTGASEDPSAHKLPLTLPSRLAAQQAHHRPLTEPKKPNFKLHERRSKKLELNIGVSERQPIMFLNNNMNMNMNMNMMMMMSNMNMSSPSYIRSRESSTVVMASPVSTLDVLARGSPRTPKSPHEEKEEQAIAEKGYYLHPSPLSTPRGSSQPPELLPLFPLHSPSSHHNNNHTNHSSPSHS